jgi:uncharacterized delta-60 repeat protein
MKSTRNKIAVGRAARPVRATLAVTFVALLLMWNFPAHALSSAGDLDPSFGGDGKVTTSFSSYDYVSAIAVQPDGKVVAAGSARSLSEDSDFALARYNPDGTLDTTFGSMGRVTTNFSWGDAIYAMALLPDGKIVVAGRGYSYPPVAATARGLPDGEIAGRISVPSTQLDFAVARYNSNGTLDTTFGSGGKVFTDFFGSDDWANALVVTDDGKILAAGRVWNPASHEDFGLVRYNPDGSLDTSFGDNGLVVTDLRGSYDYAYGLGVQSNGKIVVGGFEGGDFALVRYKPNGKLDKSFDSDGKVFTDFYGDWDGSYSLEIQPDDKILLAGSAGVSNGHDIFALARYEANGTLDQTFGFEGKVTTDFGYYSTAIDVIIQADGRIIAVGEIFSERGDFDFAVARYNTDGSLDPSFGSTGMVTTDFVQRDDHATAAAIAPDGRIIVGGYADISRSSQVFDFAVVCYLAKGTPSIIGASISGKKLYVYGANFDDDADIYLNGERQKTKNDSDKPDRILMGKKAGKKIEPGQTVMLQVRCPDGRWSNVYFFTRPLE